MKWAALAASFIAAQLTFACSLALEQGFYAPPPLGAYFTTAMLPVVLYACWLVLQSLREGTESPIAHLASIDWRPLRNFALAMLLMWLQFICLTWTKKMIPFASQMWADPMLANLEFRLLGRDTWQLLPSPSYWFETPYFLWGFAICLGFVITYFRQTERREASLLAFFVTVGLLGTLGQFLLPSGGPIFFERLGFGDRFASMDIPQKTALLGDYLWAGYERRSIEFGGGISAFPSIHVATCAWLAFATRHWLAYLYCAAIFAASIILGWHYALDGIAGIAGAALCYWLANALLAIRVNRPVGLPLAE